MALITPLRRAYYHLQDAWRLIRFTTGLRRQHVRGSVGCVTYCCFAGLANRLRAHHAARLISRRLGLPLHVAWPRNAQCGATADEILAESGWLAQPQGRRHVVLHPDHLDRLDRIPRDAVVVLHHHWQYLPITTIHERLAPPGTPPEGFPFHASITALVDETLALMNGRPDIGVHIRRGDFVTHTGQAKTTAWYADQIRTACPSDRILTIFLATDGGQTVADELQSLLPNSRVIHPPTLTARHDAQQARYAVRDMRLLAMCPIRMLTPGSSFGEIAAWMHLIHE